MKKILLILLFSIFFTSVNAQCSITITTNTSAITCGSTPLSSCNGIVYIGNGTNAMSLNMNADLDLVCLGAIQFIVRNNATIDFDAGNNKDLKLAAGSSIVFESGSAIKSTNNCSASDLITIGGSAVSNCNGSNVPSFNQVVANGGINAAGILSGNQYICTYGSTTTAFSSTSTGGTWSSGNTSIATVNSTTGDVTAVGPGTAIITYTRSGVTATRNVYVSSSAPAQPGAISGTTPQCPALTGQVYSIAPVSGASSYTWTVPTGWSITAGQGTTSVTVTTGSSSQSGNLMVTASNACGTSNGTYYYVNINTAISTNSPTANNIPVTNGYCGYKELSWNQVSNAIGYYLDIATDNGFTNFVTGYQNHNITYNNGTYPVYNLPNGTLYYRIRAYDNCNVSSYSASRTIIVSASPNSGTIVSSQTICSGTRPADLVLTGNANPVIRWESSNEISFNTKQNIASTSNTLTGAVIGNLTQNTYFRAITNLNTQMPSGQWCDGVSTLVLITVINTISPASSSPTLCVNTAMTNITYTTSGFTGIGTPTNLPAGVTASFANNIITISGTPTVSGLFNYSIPLTGGSCGATNASGTITVTTVPATPGVITQPTNKCAGTSGIFSITGITGASSYTWSVTGTGWAVTSGQGTVSANITIGSGVGTVSATASNSCGTSSASTTGNISPNLLSIAPTGITGATTICNGNSTTLTVNGGTAGTGATAQWFAGSCGGTSVGTGNSITVSPTSNTTYYVRYSGTCNTTTCASQLITVNPRPIPSFTTPAQPQTCADSHITYTTQSGQSNYVWTVSGVLNTDYRLIARGTSTDHDIVIEWLTGGSKTVTVNYNNSNGCNGASPATYTTNVTVIDRGRVIGGAHICKGNPLPTLTLQNDAGNSIYPDSSVVLKWQYSDDLNNATWHDIAGTGGQTSYTPAAFLGAFRTYQVVLQNGNCTRTSIESRINIDALNTPTFGTITNPTCTVSTGSVVLNNLPTGNWTINQTGAATTSYSNTTANTTSYTINGLAAGTYTFTVNEGNCTSDPSTINLTQGANIWDGTKWSKTNDTTLPSADDSIIFEGNYTVSSDLTACSCTVNSGNVRVSAGRTLNITNAVTVNGGTLAFENSASLVQTANVANSGNIIYKRISQPMKNFDYTYWSSPVSGQTTVGLSPNTLSDKYFRYEPAKGWVLNRGTMEPGIGYIIRTPKAGTWPAPYAETVVFPYSQPVQFTGVPNNGNITSSQAMTAGNFYLIGNPYPSALKAEDFLYGNANNHTVLNGTIYLWTHNTAIQQSGPKLIYVSDDYASFNATGGTGTIDSGNTGTNNTIPSGYIAAGQSFFASAKANGSVEFDNSMRAGGTENAQFFKPGKTSKSAGLEKHRLWLTMTNAGGAYKQTLIGYVQGATNSFDGDYDGLSFDGNSYIDFYSVNADDNLTIQGRALPFTDTDLVPLGYRSTIAGDFTIAIDKTDGNLSTQRVYLEDRQTGTINELTAGNYTFTTKAGTFKDRFVLRYSNKTLGTGDFQTTDDTVWVVIQNKTVTINSTVENIDKVFIYDISGKQLYRKDAVKDLQLIMQELPFAQQVLLVKIVLDNGYQTTKKVIFK